MQRILITYPGFFKLLQNLYTSVTFISLMSLSVPLLSFAQNAPIEVFDGQYLVRRNATSVYNASGANRSYAILQASHSGEIELVKIKKNINSLSSDSLLANDDGKALFNSEKALADCKEILMDTSLSFCEPNYIYYAVGAVNIPNDSLFSSQLGLHDTVNGWDIDAPQAWQLSTGSNDTIVAILDTGVNFQHPDLFDNIWVNPGEIPNNGIDDDANGYIDDVYGVNTFVNSSNPSDLNGHGSHVAGIVGARGNNASGVAGVNWNIKMIPVAASNANGEFSALSIFNGIEYIYNLKKYGGINIVAVNASLGGSVNSEALYYAIDKLRSIDITLVAAAGNEHSNNDVTPVYPANYDLDNIVSVAAINQSGLIAGFSNIGPQTVDIAAPGQEIISTWNQSSACEGTGDTDYCSISGTSMAAPMVTGAIGLLYSYKGHITHNNLIDTLYNNSYFDPYYQQYVKTGRLLNLFSILSAAGPQDLCPNDSKKIDPGVCGCGLVENYVDSDNDNTLNCLDSCPSDPAKTVAGECGCGVSDADSDSDGSKDCTDFCPLDASKLTPGICGCGVSDQDANGNGIVDCNDIDVVSLVPKAPKVSVSKKTLNYSVSLIDGLRYTIKIDVSTPSTKGRKSKIRSVYYRGSAAKGVIKKIPAGSTVVFRYAYFLDGAIPKYSQFSASKKVKIK